jgi:peptidyl-prolyl cis-trans isomerase SurA
MTFLRVLLLALLAALPAFLAQTERLAAQNLFAPVARVNDKVVTQFELDQRIRFLEALRAPGVMRESALDALIDERLQLQAGEQLGIEITDEQILAGMEEFAQRAELTTEQFVAAITQEGVSRETFEDFVRAGLVWREVVGARFAPQATVTEAEIDRAMALASTQGGIRVLMSEIILPADTPDRAAEARRIASELSRIRTLPDFAAAARKYSVAPSRERSGRMDWTPLGNLPPQIAQQVLGLQPGEVTPPIPIPNGIVVFQLRALEETRAATPETLAVDFARYFIPGGRTEAALAQAARIAAEVDTCDDLYGVAKGQPEDRLMRDTLPMAEIAGDIALELAQLDAGEISTNLTTADGQTLVFLMLCGRTTEMAEELSREQVRENLTNQRLESFAAGYLSELRADAVISYP